ncbi:hypothetical protein KIL84_011394, partial [Mauremys mutica]
MDAQGCHWQSEGEGQSHNKKLDLKGLKLGTFIHNMKMLLTLFLFLIGSQTSVTQTPGYVDTEEADIYVLIDGSTSISPVAFGDIKIFLKEVIKMFNIGPNKVRFGAVQFSHNRRLEFELDEYSKTNDLETAIDTMRQITGDTYTGEALTFMQPLFKKAREQRAGRVPCHLIVLTDGESHDSVKEPAERLRSEMVNIYAIGVKDANEAQLLEIAGSKSRTFFVQEFDSLKNIKNEIVQGIRSGEACKEMTADIMFLVDSSGSIGPENFSKMKNFMRELVNKSDISADRMQVGVVQFSGTNKEEFQLDRYSSKSDIFSAIDRMSLIGENTLTGSALSFVADYFKPLKGARLAVKKFLILITDGEAQDEVKSPARALRDQDVVIYSVGVFNANKPQLEEISGKPELVFYVENFDILKHIEDEIIFGICRPHEVRICTYLPVRVFCFFVICSSTEFKRLERLDVVFVIDGSGSISPLQYQAMKDFMIALVKKSDVAPDRVQFGAVKYSDEPETFFYLNNYITKSEIIKAIQNDATLGGSTYTAKAIGYSEALFAQEHGGRKSKGVPQILIVITDGESHDAAQLGDTAKRLRDNGIIIYAVGIEGANPAELLAMAGSEDKYYYVDTFEGLTNTSIAISEKIYDDSKPGKCFYVSSVCREASVVDIVFLVDGSWSIGKENFRNIQDFLYIMVSSFDVGEDKIRIGLIQYSDAPHTEFFLNSYHRKEYVLEEIQKLHYKGGGTKTGQSLQFMLENHFKKTAGSRREEGVPQIAVVITDGQAQDNILEPAKEIKDAGITLYAIGIKGASLVELQEIASDPDDKHVYEVEDFTDLQDISHNMLEVLCTTVEEVNQIAHVSQVCRKATLADIVFLVDTSTSIGQENFQKVKNFLYTLVSSLDVSSDQIRVGLAQYSDETFKVFLLNQYSLKSDILEQIQNLPYRSGERYTGTALDFVRITYFTESAGSRALENIPQVVILVTDGESNDEVKMPANKLKARGISVYVVGINVHNTTKLQEIANKPLNKFLFSIDSYDVLQDLPRSLLQTMCFAVESQIK